MCEHKNPFFGSSPWVEAMEKDVEQCRCFGSEARKCAVPLSERPLPELPPNVKHVTTLVLDQDGVLERSDWMRGRGSRTFKRPGVDVFLNPLSGRFELLVCMR